MIILLYNKMFYIGGHAPRICAHLTLVLVHQWTQIVYFILLLNINRRSTNDKITNHSNLTPVPRQLLTV